MEKLVELSLDPEKTDEEVESAFTGYAGANPIKLYLGVKLLARLRPELANKIIQDIADTIEDMEAGII